LLNSESELLNSESELLNSEGEYLHPLFSIVSLDIRLHKAVVRLKNIIF